MPHIVINSTILVLTQAKNDVHKENSHYRICSLFILRNYIRYPCLHHGSG